MARPKKEKPNRADGLYEVKITIGKKPNGKLIRKSFYSSISKEDARKQAENYRVNQKVEDITGVQINERNIPFEQWARKWLKAYKEKSVSPLTYETTYKNYVEGHLIPYFGGTNIVHIKPADIQAFYNQKSSELYQSSLDKIRLCLNGIFESAVDNEICLKNPCKGLSPKSALEKHEKRVYSRPECYTLMKYAQTHEYGICIMLLLCMGLRRGELCGLKWEDIDIEHKVLCIKRAVTREQNRPVIGKPKTKTSIRALPFSTSMSKYLEKQKDGKSGFIITNKYGEIMLPQNFMKNRYNRFMKDFDRDINSKRKHTIPILNPHELRHTCGTWLYDRTQNIYAVSKFLGHADVQITTKIYIHDDIDSLRNSLNLR